MNKFEGYDDGEITCTDVYSIADGSGRDIWTATLSGLCHVYYAIDRDNPVDFILEGMNGNLYVGELKNREKCPPERKAKYNKEGWMYEEWKDKCLKAKMKELGAKDALYVTITDDYVNVWKTGHQQFKFFMRDCTATTAENYRHGQKPKSCCDLKIEDARWRIKR